MAISILKEHEIPPTSEEAAIHPVAARLEAVRSTTNERALRALRRRQEWKQMMHFETAATEEQFPPCEPIKPKLRIVKVNDTDDNGSPEEKPLAEIQRWASQITNPITLTYKVICKKFNDRNLNKWRRFEYFLMPNILEVHTRRALDRLVKITNHEKYQYDFVVEYNPKKGYRLTKIGHTADAEEDESDDELADEQDDESETEGKTNRNDSRAVKLTKKDIERIPATTSTEREFCNLLLCNNRLKIEEECELLKRAVNGDKKAKEKLTYSYFRLAASIAISFCGGRSEDQNFWDLFQEGVIGIGESIDKFDIKFLERGLYQHARTYILKNIRRSCENRYFTSPVRKPTWMCGRIREIEKATKHLTSADGVEPTPEAIANYIGIATDKILEALNIQGRRALRQSDTYAGTERNPSDQFFRIIHTKGAGSRVPEPDRHFIEKECIDVIFNALRESGHFSDDIKLKRAIYILRRLFTGDAEGTNPTLFHGVNTKELGAEIGMSHEAVRLMTIEALKILRGRFTCADFGIEPTGQRLDVTKLKKLIQS